MKRLIFGFVFVLLLIQSAYALQIQNYDINFDIQSDSSVRESLNITFRETLDQTTLNYIIVGDFSDLKITNGNKQLDYNVTKTDNEYSINFLIPAGTKRLNIGFVSKDLVFQKDNVYQFFTNFRPPKETEVVNIQVSLPPGFILYRDMFSPENAEKLTDGEKIYFTWSFVNRTEEIPISVKFQGSYKTYDWILYVVVIIVLLMILLYSFSHYRKKAKKEFLKGFFEDEKKVVEILTREGVAYQNKIEKELKFSRAKMTRIVKKLEAKDLVTKERVGRTNRIYWKKN